MTALLLGGSALLAWAVLCISPARSRWWFARWHLREAVFYALPCFGLVALVAKSMEGLPEWVLSEAESMIAAPLLAGPAAFCFPITGMSLARWVGPGWARDAMRSLRSGRGQTAPVQMRDHVVHTASHDIRVATPRMWSRTTFRGTLLALAGPSLVDGRGVVVSLTDPRAIPDGFRDTRLLHVGEAHIGERRLEHRIELLVFSPRTRHSWLIEGAGGRWVVHAEFADLDAPFVLPLLERVLASITITPTRGR